MIALRTDLEVRVVVVGKRLRVVRAVGRGNGGTNEINRNDGGREGGFAGRCVNIVSYFANQFEASIQKANQMGTA